MNSKNLKNNKTEDPNLDELLSELRNKLKTSNKENFELKKAIKELTYHGGIMSNILYNLSQTDSSLNKGGLVKEWYQKWDKLTKELREKKLSD